jgi:hypothetical protein
VFIESGIQYRLVSNEMGFFASVECVLFKTTKLPSSARVSVSLSRPRTLRSPSFPNLSPVSVISCTRLLSMTRSALCSFQKPACRQPSTVVPRGGGRRFLVYFVSMADLLGLLATWPDVDPFCFHFLTVRSSACAGRCARQ